MCENSHEFVSGGNQTHLQLLEGVAACREAGWLAVAVTLTGSLS